jgi:hypothetical protein
MSKQIGLALVACIVLSSTASASILVHYTVAAGGTNADPLNGMVASALFDISGGQLTILMENVSTGTPVGATAADSLLVSLGFNLPGDVTIFSGDSALIGPGSDGVGLWDGLVEGDNVGDQWLWTNDGGGDELGIYSQVISTSQGHGGADTWSFNGEPDPLVSGPFGGIAADPPLINIPADKPAVSDSILFTLTLSDTLTSGQLESIAFGSMVEFGSDFQYLTVPAPPALSAMLLALLHRRRRR